MNRALIASAVLALSATLAGPANAQLPRELSLESGETCTGKPVVVAQRNDAAHALRDAFHDAHKQLQSLRGGGKDVDHQAVKDAADSANSALRERLTSALNDVAALTLGRNGQQDADTDEDADTEEADTEEDTDNDEDSDTDEDADTADDSGEHGRPCDVPAPAADQAALDALVEDALSDMQQIVQDALDDLGVEPGDSAELGSSGGHGKPEWAGGPSTSHGRSGEHGKPDKGNDEDND